MSFKLAKGEHVVKSYEYGTTKLSGGLANSSVSTKTLTVTNKRIVHSVSGTGGGTEFLSYNEVPISKVTCVDTDFSKKRYPHLLICGILMLIMGITAWVAIEDFGVYLGIPGLAIAAFSIINYIIKKDYVLDCEIYTSSADLKDLMSFSTRTSSSKSLSGKKRKGAKTKIKISVNEVEARELANELSAVIMDAKNEAAPIVKEPDEDCSEHETDEDSASTEN